MTSQDARSRRTHSAAARLAGFLALAVAACAVAAGCGGEAAREGRPTAVLAAARTERDDQAVVERRSVIDRNLARIKAEYDEYAAGRAPGPPVVDLLVISGGADWGAFGAGILKGWGKVPDGPMRRPEFDAVTGVSTGALIAPFAFLGSDYDEVLEEVYTNISPDDVASPRSVIAAIGNDGMADNLPLWDLISKHVDERLLAAIAVEHEKGRILLIGTTDLDARQPVVWNMGNIAASGSSDALALFRSILLASAAIPGAFPPTLVTVDVDGRRYQEMHVDGGATAQVFMYPPTTNSAELKKAANVERKATVYIIRNARLDPGWAMVDRRTLTIAGRAVSSLIQNQGLGDLNRIYLTSLRDGVDYNLAYIPADFNVPRTGEFQPAYMRPLFERGYEMGRLGYPWRKTPPGYDAPIETTAAASAR
jgi:predicted acylesterase/phospholipase RssA